jgi:hypothetical protein
MATQRTGWAPVGDPVQRLLDAIDECEAQWGEDPAYKDVTFKLEQVEQELDTIVSSPGHRASLRALAPSNSGQEPTERSEPPSKAEKGY